MALGAQSDGRELLPSVSSSILTLGRAGGQEGRSAGQVAGLCFRGKSFREPELSRKEINLPKHSFSAGAEIQSRHHRVSPSSKLMAEYQLPSTSS